MLRLRGVGLLGLVVAGLGMGSVSLADVTTERSGSILVFPRVIANGDENTIIRLANTSNSLVHAHCFYVNGALTFPERDPGPLNPPLWQEIDFDITLTRQQPTHWVVSEGRFVNPFDPTCGPQNRDCPDAGFDPGRVPPVVPDFTGELKCVEVDDSGAPLSGNHLKGEAVIVLPSFGGDIATYNALAIEGSENNGDGTLVLGGGQCAGDGGAKGAVCTTDDDCADSAPCAAEYNACPQTWILNHLADEAPNIAIEEAGNGPSRVETELTVVPCTENFETQQPTSVTIQFITTNEFESQFSSSTTITCWGDFFFDDFATTAFLFGPGGAQPPDPQGTMYLQTRMRAAGATPYGMLMVALEHHIDEPGNEAHAAVNLHVEGARSVPDIITIPNDQLTP